MKLSMEGRFRYAIHCTFVLGAAGMFAVPSAQAAENDAAQLQGVEVTGSRIRRVDTETSDTVQVLDRKQIQATGAATLGELLQSIPSFGGTPYNPSVNNGGGTGAAYVDLRGLAPKRTLVLLDGQRLNDSDVNALPSNMIERIEVLKEGAAAVYGTDAIGGVVNFISRKTFTGVEAEVSAGTTEKGDGSNGDIQLTWGTKMGAGNAVFGASFNRQDAISASSRSTSNAPWGLYYGQNDPNAWTSSRGPNGRFSVSGFSAAANPADSLCPTSFGGITLIDGQDGTSTSDYRKFCNNVGPGHTDRYNYQPENLSLTPSKRFSLFGIAQEPIGAGIKWTASGAVTNTQANAQLAAEPFDFATIQGTYPGSAPTLSKDSIYNPFGTDITTFYKRSTAVGDRILSYDTTSIQAATGLKGDLLDRFQWDVGFNYGRSSTANSNYGFLNFSKIFQQIGPSFYSDPLDPTHNTEVSSSTPGAVPTCGTPGNSIPNCAPVNVFGTTGNTLATLGTTTNFLNVFDEQDVTANIAGDLFKLPAGPVGAATGFEYRNLHYKSTPDQLAQEFSLSENNSQATGGSYNAREAFVEFRIPVLAHLPGVQSLNFSLGGRYSNFSSFGSSTAGKAAMEYRPYSDLLVRATYTDVYRAPTTAELYLGASQGSPSVTDPCNGSDAAGVFPDGTTLADHPIACANVSPEYSQNTSQVNGNVIGDPNLQPEKGYATDFGLVFDPSFYKPLSISVDYWVYSLKKAIDPVGIQTILSACYNDESSAFCGNAPNGLAYFTRSATPDADGYTGNVVNSYEPYSNANRYKVNGIDSSVKLNYPKVAFRGWDFGRVSMGIDVTYLMTYNLKNSDPFSGEVVANYSEAGTYDANTGNSFPRLRGLGYLFWSKGPFSIALQDRYIGNLKENGVDAVDVLFYGLCGTPGYEGDSYNAAAPGYGGSPNNTVVCNRNAGSANYVDVAGTYAFKRINTDFTVGVTDLFSDGAQQMYNANLAGAANPIYDIRGRSFYGKMVVRFK